MRNTIEVQIKDLPKDLTTKVNEHIRLFSITMLLDDGNDNPERPCSGTLVTIKEKKGILTARHVWEQIQNYKTLLIMYGPAPYLVSTRLLSADVPPTQNKNERISTDIPDLALIKLPETAITYLEALSKAFYSIDKRQSKEYKEFIENGIGYYAIFGAPEELIDYENRTIQSFIYNTFVRERFEDGEWDYQIISIDLDENPELPKNFQGVSGGGIWKIYFHVNEEKSIYGVKDPSNDIALIGVNFNQTELEGRKIIGHGSESIYRGMYNLVDD